MTQLPKPQEQLQSYFNDLLVDECGELVVRQAAAAKTEKMTGQALPTETARAAESASLPVEPSLQLSPAETAQREFVQNDLSADEVSAHELQQQKLQALLHSLPPAVITEPAPVKSVTETPVIESTATLNVAPTIDTTDYPDAISEIATEQQLLDIAGTSSFAPPAPLFTGEWLDNGRPAWAQDPFDILLLEVQDIKVAVPLATLGQIHRLDEHLTPLFGQAEWFIGIQKTTMGNIKTIDIAQFIMPERYNALSKTHHKYVVAIDGIGWGFAVDEIDQPVHIDPSDIRWRTNRSDRKWMAGTVKEHTCVLLDIPALGETFVGNNTANRAR